MLFELNIADTKRDEFVSSNIGLDSIKNIVAANNPKKDIVLTVQILNKLKSDVKLSPKTKEQLESYIQNIYK
jgi:hypothetical protein